MTGVRVPLALSLAGHAALLAALVLLAVAPQPHPATPTLRGIELILAPPQPKPAPAARPVPPKPPAVRPPPKPIVQPAPARVPLPPVAKPPPRPRHERVIRRVERPPPRRRRPEIHRAPIRPRFVRPEVPPAPSRPRYVPPPPPEPAIPHPAPPPRPPAAATISPGYRASLIGWIEAHRYYPESAREEGEEGEVLLRFRIDRSGRVVDAAVARSSGYPDLDQAALAMMRGASLPPFPPSMPQQSIVVAVPIRFSLR